MKLITECYLQQLCSQTELLAQLEAFYLTYDIPLCVSWASCQGSDSADQTLLVESTTVDESEL